MVEPRAFVLLKSRRQLDLLNPDPHAWTDDDLAAGLSRPRECRGQPLAAGDVAAGT